MECVIATPYDNQKRCQSRCLALRLICAAGIVLLAPLVILCAVGMTTSLHVKHYFRFHRYVGSSEEKSDVLFHDDENNIFKKLGQYLYNTIVENALAGIELS